VQDDLVLRAEASAEAHAAFVPDHHVLIAQPGALDRGREFGTMRQSQNTSSEPLPRSSLIDSKAIARSRNTSPAVPMLSPTNQPKREMFSERRPWPFDCDRLDSETLPLQYGGSVITASIEPSGMRAMTCSASP
jgi:hypothetical protein